MKEEIIVNRKMKQLVADALFKVINSAPSLHYNHYGAQSDVSQQEFNIWMDYVFKTLDISFNYTGISPVLSTKSMIFQLASNNIPYINRIEQIKFQLHNLIQMILQF